MRVASTSEGATANEEFVDVGDEAVEAPPSLPPLRIATPAGALAMAPTLSPSPSRRLARVDDAEGARPLPPAIGITLLLAIIVVALVVFAR